MFVLDDKIYSGADVGGSIQLLILDHIEKSKSFHYDWVNFKKAQSLTIEGKYEMVRCEYSASMYWPEHGLLGCVNTEKLVAHFVDNEMQIVGFLFKRLFHLLVQKTTKKLEHLLVLCKIAGSRDATEKEKEKGSTGSASKLLTVVNDWEDFNWGSAWPSNK